MAEHVNIPLYLYQVLEEEYESLHGPLPPTIEASLPNPTDEAHPLDVESKRDWRFHHGHIRYPKVFADLLLDPESAAARRARASDSAARHSGPSDGKMADLTRQLRQRIELTDAGALSGVSDFKRGVDGSDVEFDKRVATLMKALNEALKDPELCGEQSAASKARAKRGAAGAVWEYEPGTERFAYNWLTDETRGMLSLRESGVRFGPEDVEHLNRLLLEDAFTDVFQKVSDVRLAAVYRLFHEAGHSALSLSGGGIRSGTFALGLIQGLARHGLLQKFDYLSTVSGGGYIGGWLTAWIHRHPEGLAGVSRELAHGVAEKVDPDPAPLRYLRRYSNFITPKVGLLTADTWAFIGIYLRNTFLNWTVIVPLILSVLIIPRLLLALTLMQPEGGDSKSLFQFPWWFFSGWQVTWVGFHQRHIFLTLGILLGGWALAYVIFNKPGLRVKLEERRPWFRGKTGQAGFLALCLLPLLASAFFLTTYFAWAHEYVVDGGELGKPLWAFLGFGLSFVLVGWLLASFILKRLSLNRLVEETDIAEVGSTVAVGLLGGTLFYAASLTSLGSPIIGYSEGFNWLDTSWLAWKTELYLCTAVPLFLLVFLVAAVFFIGFTSTPGIKFVEDEDREWWARFGAWLLISIIVWVAGFGVVIFGPIGLLTLPTLLTAVGGISGLITLLVGRSPKSPAAEGQAQQSKLSALLGSLLPVLALVFILFLVAAFSLATSGLVQVLGYNAGALAALAPSLGLDVEQFTNARSFVDYQRYISDGIKTTGLPDPTAAALQLGHMNVLHHTSIWLLLNIGTFLFAGGMLLARVINLNIFSLHGGYRNRLIRAFLGASRPDHERHPNPFTGFDPSDNLHMHELRHALLAESDFDEERLKVMLASLKDAREQDAPTEKEKSKEKTGAAPEAANEKARREADVRQLSAYLVGREDFEVLWEELKRHDPQSTVPRRLMADLRTFLNGVIESEPLFEQTFGERLLDTPHARTVRAQVREDMLRKFTGDRRPPVEGWGEKSLRSDYSLLLNRLVLEEAYGGALKPCVSPPYKLMHVVNTTLNLVGGKNLAWQQRKAEPFSVSPLHAGCFRVGYRDSREYGGRETNGISLGTAATASGAAASSNMGYYTTSPVISLLLTLFNVRLGLWLGNPGPHGRQTYHLNAPTLSFGPVLAEAFGLTDDTNPYVYLTDGGHFENLALYEMILRRCHFIVVSDGAQDGDFRFGDLGNAVRKIRIDLGVPIDFWDVPIYAKAPPAEEGRGVYWSLARIRYTSVDKGPGVRDGVLLYVKPTIYGDEPRDVLEYKQSFPTFPHQSTGDQFFDEPQFESYRMLGSHIMDRICGDGREPLELSNLIHGAINGLRDAKPDNLLGPFRLNREFLKWMDKCVTEHVAVAPPAQAAADDEETDEKLLKSDE
jgi:hypothetical protein